MIAETTNLSTAGFNMLEPKEITLDTMNYPTGSNERKADWPQAQNKGQPRTIQRIS